MTTTTNKSPIWAWFVLLAGGWFLLNFGYNTILLIVNILDITPNTIHILLYTVQLCLAVVCGWGVKKAYRTIQEHSKQTKPVQNKASIPANSKKPIWPWIVIGAGALPLVTMGPGVLMLPIMPLFLAGMSTDSGTTPSYVPGLIILVGYGILIGYTILLIKAIKVLRNK